VVDMAEHQNESVKVLLADDHQVVRAGFRMLLEEIGGFEVAETDSGESACEYVRQHPVDVIVMDLSMPGIGGLEAVRRIVSRKPKAYVLVLSMYEDDVFAMRALSAGARGFVSKRVAPEELVEAIRVVRMGDTYLSAEMARRLATRRFSQSTDPFTALSTREFEIFRRLSRGESASEIAKTLKLSVKTVSNHRLSILRKLGAKNTVELAHLSLRHGLADDVDAAESP